MKNKVLIFTVVMLLVLACNVFAQNTNNQQRIIGTWIDSEGKSWVFNANGTCIFDGVNSRYFVNDSKLIVRDSYSSIMDIIISSDGRILVIFGLYNERTLGKWLDKR